jgi:hypothetical protein
MSSIRRGNSRGAANVSPLNLLNAPDGLDLMEVAAR